MRSSSRQKIVDDDDELGAEDMVDDEFDCCCWLDGQMAEKYGEPYVSLWNRSVRLVREFNVIWCCGELDDDDSADADNDDDDEPVFLTMIFNSFAEHLVV